MNEKQISQICLAIIIIGIILFVISYENEFPKKTISELITTQGNKGLVFGRVKYVIKTEPATLFILTDGNEVQVYYPKPIEIQTNDFLSIYAQSQIYNGKPELIAHRIDKE